ncbi:MAG TPA: hypothetical protein VLF93_04900 [Candidatus Saccharimonadales bacterium]|nr:hypothetical protein [Candidatus Saccharimonadales bacterium]
MRHHKRPLLLLIIGILSLLALASLIYFVPPNTGLSLSQLDFNLPFSLDKFIQIPSLILFFTLLIAFFFSITSYIFKSKAQGILVTSFVVIYFIFRLTHLTNLFFLILLVALFVTLELFLTNRRD